MKTLTIGDKNGHSITYQLIDGDKDMPIAYHIDTPSDLVQKLESIRKNRTRVKLHYGDRETGKDWNEENYVTGTIGLSKGTDAYYPLLIDNKRSMGGGHILDHCIIKIKLTTGPRNVIYKAPNYKQSTILLVDSVIPGYTNALSIDGQIYSNHKTRQSATRLMQLLS